MIIPTYKEMYEAGEKTKKMLEEIDYLLKQHEYDILLDLFRKKEVKELAAVNQSIYTLSIMFYLMEYELKTKGKTTLANKNSAQIIRIYRVLSLYLRRIEFSFSEEEQKEILNYIQQEEIGLEIIIGIITNNTSIIKKEKVIDGFSKLMI